jgi:hypothetical protein
MRYLQPYISVHGVVMLIYGTHTATADTTNQHVRKCYIWDSYALGEYDDYGLLEAV